LNTPECFEGFVDPYSATVGTGAGGNTVLSLRPPLGELWEIISLVGWHDDTTSRAVGFGWTNPTSGVTIDFSLGAAIAATVFAHLGEDAHMLKAPVASYYSYPTVTMYAATASKNFYIRALVRKLRGSMNMAGS
jgi:hypothetical protein